MALEGDSDTIDYEGADAETTDTIFIVPGILYSFENGLQMGVDSRIGIVGDHGRYVVPKVNYYFECGLELLFDVTIGLNDDSDDFKLSLESIYYF